VRFFLPTVLAQKAKDLFYWNENGGSTISSDRVDLTAGRSFRHETSSADTEGSGGPCEGLCGVPCADGADSSPALLLAKRGDGIEDPADLERCHRLMDLGLEKDVTGFFEGMKRYQRGVEDHLAYPR